MNSGLPSLLDAIFGKQDLTLVSLDEIYEVIREFPSFNAGHFLLAKKLKLQEDPGYEMETKRTALYFNNPFWLQSLLDDGNHFQQTESSFRAQEVPDEDQLVFEEYPEETLDTIQKDGNYIFESYTPIVQPVAKKHEIEIDNETEVEKDELDLETEEILEEKQDSDPVRSEETFQFAEPGAQTVTSFDELMAKYNIQPLELVDESAAAPEASLPSETLLPPESTLTSEEILPAMVDIKSEPGPVPELKIPAVETNNGNATSTDSQPEGTLEEVVNEYGVFEEKVIKKVDHDHDMDAFDEPLDQIPFVSDKIVEEATPIVDSGNTAHAVDPLHQVIVDDAANTADNSNVENTGIIENAAIADNQEYDDAANTADNSNVENTGIIENAAIADNQESNDSVSTAENSIVENTGIIENAAIADNQESEYASYQTDEHDYDAFDKPPEESVQAEVSVNGNEYSNELTDYDPDNTGEPVEYSNDSEEGANGEMQELSERFGEQQKILSVFNAKNADSIVFTPYHMVDYFASQGIKLILEDNPPDQFGKQLKSFTDWLKVMKKLPPKPSSEREDEKENEQIRHIAAHSIEERDILTESMAEVLAKQGMYENAIALFHKLSLIYPPKSAYFASRIEQLKASLP